MHRILILVIFFLFFFFSVISAANKTLHFSFLDAIPAQNISFLGQAFPSDGSILFASTGQALQKSPLRFGLNHTFKASFSTSFTFRIIADPAIAPAPGTSVTLAFVLLPHINRIANLSLSNPPAGDQAEDHSFAVLFISWEDSSHQHAGFVGTLLDGNSSFLNPDLQDRFNISANVDITVWIDYDGAAETIQVSLSNRSDGRKPNSPILSHNLQLSQVFTSPMYVGFSASLGTPGTKIAIVSWNFSISVISSDKESRPCKPLRYKRYLFALILGFPILVILVLFGVSRCQSKIRNIQTARISSMLDFPSPFTYRELSLATGGFSTKNILSTRHSTVIYKGVLPSDNSIVAVKCFANTVTEGRKGFLAEISVISKLGHRNLVPLRGWCDERGKLMLVHDYMPHGTLDILLFGGSKLVLGWDRRYNILKSVAAVLAYLHDDCEKQVVHRDVKTANVYVDADYNGRLGDFGVMRLLQQNAEHARSTSTTGIAGTLGYVVPEIAQTGRATAKSDVFGFGILSLEVACGRPASWGHAAGEEGGEEGDENEATLLLEWVWGVKELSGHLLDAADPKLEGRYKEREVLSVIQIALLCCHPDPDHRPSMRQVKQMLEEELEIPDIPRHRPVAKYHDYYGLEENPYNDQVMFHSDSSRDDCISHSEIMPR